MVVILTQLSFTREVTLRFSKQQLFVSFLQLLEKNGGKEAGITIFLYINYFQKTVLEISDTLQHMISNC